MSDREYYQLAQSIRFPTSHFVARAKFRYRSLIYPFEQIVKLIPSDSNVLEIGCGQGLFLFFLKQLKNCEVFGTDLDIAALERARTILDLPENRLFVTEPDMQEVYRNLAKMDYIVLSDVIHHIPRSHQRDWISGILNTMSEGQKLLIKDIAAEDFVWLPFNKLHDLVLARQFSHELRSTTCRSILEENGFKIHSAGKRRMICYSHFWFLAEKMKI